MDLKRFYGYTGLVSAKTTGYIFFFLDLFIWLYGLVYGGLLKLGICERPESIDWDDFLNTIEEFDAEERKREIREKKKRKIKEKKRRYMDSVRNNR